jgi:GxxExxY protein
MAVAPELNALSEKVIGAAIEVHRALGSGFLESTYEKAFSIELSLQNLDHQLQVPVTLNYKGRPIGEGKIDVLVERQLVVELKAVSHLADAHTTQLLAYLKATDLNLGLLLNFHAPLLRDGIRRVAN